MDYKSIIKNNVEMGFPKPTKSITVLKGMNLADLELLIWMNAPEMEILNWEDKKWESLLKDAPAEFTPEGHMRIYSENKIKSRK